MRRPQSNGFVERLHRTLLDEHFRIKGREKYYETVVEMQVDLSEAWPPGVDDGRNHTDFKFAVFDGWVGADSCSWPRR